MPRRPFHEPYPLGVLGTPELILEPSRGWGEVGRKERKKIKQFSPLLPHLRLGSLRTLPPTLSRFPLPFGKWVSFQAFHSPKSNQISSASPSNQRKCLENGVTSITKDSQTGNPEPGNPDIFKKTQVKSLDITVNQTLENSTFLSGDIKGSFLSAIDWQCRLPLQAGCLRGWIRLFSFLSKYTK